MARSLFKKYNYNPKNKREGDCVIRALCAVTGNSWLDVYDALYKLGRDNYCMPNSKTAYEKYLKDNDYAWTYLKIVKGQKRQTVKQFARAHKSGKYFLSVANHVVAVIDGQYIDTWDSGECCLYGYWSKS